MNRVFSRRSIPTTCAASSIRTPAAQRLPVHLRLRRYSGRRERARYVGAGQAHRQGHARRQAVDAGGLEVDPLPRLLGAPELGQRDEEDLQARRAYLLSPTRMGRRRRRADLGRSGGNRQKKPPNEEAKGPVSHSREWLESEEGQAAAPRTPANSAAGQLCAAQMRPITNIRFRPGRGRYMFPAHCAARSRHDDPASGPPAPQRSAGGPRSSSSTAAAS